MEKISETQSQLRFQIDEKLAIGNKILRALENNVQLAENDITQIQSSIQSYLEQLEIEQQQKKDLEDKIQSKSRILEAKEVSCSQAGEDYRIEREGLEESRLIVSELLGILRADARSVREYFVKQGKLNE